MGDTPAKKPKLLYDCVDCPAFCCSVYDRVQVKPSDVRRLAKHFNVTEEVAASRYTKMWQKERVLRRRKDKLMGEACQFVDPKTRGCMIYHARPAVCREFPTTKRCVYYDLMTFEREQQDDPKVVPVVRITFRK